MRRAFAQVSLNHAYSRLCCTTHALSTIAGKIIGHHQATCRRTTTTNHRHNAERTDKNGSSGPIGTTADLPTVGGNNNNNNNVALHSFAHLSLSEDNKPIASSATGFYEINNINIKRVPKGFWRDVSKHKQFFEWAAKQLGVARFEDWYQVTSKDIARLGGTGLLSHYYDNSLIRALATLYPEYEWIPWKFSGRVPLRFWTDVKNRRRFFDWVAQELGITKPEDWYAVTRDQIDQLAAAGGLLDRYYHGSLQRALADVYPKNNNNNNDNGFDWLPWKFADGAPNGFWKDPQTHRRFFDWAAKQLGIAGTEEDWYRVQREDIYKLGGAGLLIGYYEGSLIKALASVYPEFEWKPWRFRGFILRKDGASSVFNNNNNNSGTTDALRSYVEFLSRELGIRHFDDWYRVGLDQIRRLGGFSIITHYGGLYLILKQLYPEHPWNEHQFHNARGKKSSQRRLKVALQNILPDREIIEEYAYPDPQPTTDSPSTTILLDIWIPSLSLAFEYQGAQHYHDLHLFGDATKQQARDEMKKDLCAKAGITLVQVPYWWDHSEETLRQMIFAAQPNLDDVSQLK